MRDKNNGRDRIRERDRQTESVCVLEREKEKNRQAERMKTSGIHKKYSNNCEYKTQQVCQDAAH